LPLGGPIPNRCCVNYTDYWFNRDRLQGVCVDTLDSEQVCITVPQPTHQPSRQRTDTTLNSYTTARIDFAVTFFSNRSEFQIDGTAHRKFRCAVPSIWNSLPVSSESHLFSNLGWKHS